MIAAVRAAAPEVIMHEMTALAGMRSLRNVDRVFAATIELRTRFAADGDVRMPGRPRPA